MNYVRNSYRVAAFCCLLMVLTACPSVPPDTGQPEPSAPIEGALDTTEWLYDVQDDRGEGMHEFAQDLTCAEEQETCNPNIGFEVYRLCPPVSTNSESPSTQQAMPVVVTDNYLVQVGDALLGELEGYETQGWIELTTSGTASQPGPDEEPLETPSPAWTSAQALTDEGRGVLEELMQNGTAFPNVLYFPTQGIFNFRPEGSPPVPFNDGDPGFVPSMTNVRSLANTTKSLPAEATPIWVIDTGSIPGQKAILNDDLVEDVYRGHGPVIRDLIVDLLREANIQNPSVTLQRVLTENSVPGGDIVSPNRMSRAFDTTALLDTLAALPTTQLVLNLSLSSQGCPDMYPPNHPLVQWFTSHTEVTTVAAAGNDGSLIPNYPAALSGILGEDPPTDLSDRIISIGASTPDGHYTCFTNFHDSVDANFVGEQLVVNHPDEGWSTWRGTSFSAPQAAAAIATGAEKAELQVAAPPADFTC